MHEILLFLFYVEKKEFGQGSIYNQQMSECIFVTNCSFENRKNLYKSDHEKSSSSSTILSSFSKEYWYYYIIQLRKKKKKERKTILHYV